MPKIQFNYCIACPNGIRTFVDSNVRVEATVYVNTDTILELLDDVVCEWDIFNENQRDFLREISGRIAEISRE